MATMTPREIQLRIRSGEPLADVVAASGLPADRVEAFAAPIIAEREHTTATALSAQIRRRGETASARRLQQTIAESMLERGQDIDFVNWDSWRRSDGRWVVQGTWNYQRTKYNARFIFDPKGRFSVADNDDARVLIGDLPLTPTRDTSSEPTFRETPRAWRVQSNLADEDTIDTPLADRYEDSLGAEEDSLRSDIDLLYDMISTIDEDSVRIFRGLREPLTALGEPSDSLPPLPIIPEPVVRSEPVIRPQSVVRPEPVMRSEPVVRAEPVIRTEPVIRPQPVVIPEPVITPVIPDLVPTPSPIIATTPPAISEDTGWSDPNADPVPPRRATRKRASVPAWDDIIFGGRS